MPMSLGVIAAEPTDSPVGGAQLVLVDLVPSGRQTEARIAQPGPGVYCRYEPGDEVVCWCPDDGTWNNAVVIGDLSNRQRPRPAAANDGLLLLEGCRVVINEEGVRIGQGAETSRTPLEGVVQALKTLGEAILAVDAAAAAKLPSSAPVATATVTPVVADCVTSLANGAPYLSSLVKVQ